MPLDVENEKKVSSQLDVLIFKADTVIQEEGRLGCEQVTQDSMVITSLPNFYINGRSYILLSHIMHLYNIREDYFLAIIADGCDAARGFVNIEVEPKEEFLMLDTETSNDNFIDSDNALALCVRKMDEMPPQLSDEDFEKRQEHLGIHNFGREFLQEW